jgi:ankyrin repeat protein
MIAIKYFRNIDVLSLLVESGINIHKINEDGENALLMAIIFDANYKKINYLIECGIDIYQTLMLAFKHKYFEFEIIMFLFNKLNKDKYNDLFEYINYSNKFYYLRRNEIDDVDDADEKRVVLLFKSKGFVPIMNNNYIYRNIYI